MALHKPHRTVTLVVVFFMTALFSSCATAPPEKTPVSTEKQIPEAEAEKQPEEGKYVPTPSEQKSLEVFQEIYDLVESTPDRQSILPEVEKLYLRIISETPDAPLARESYWRLMSIYLDDHYPPDFDKAEALYDDFIKKYPDSNYKGLLEEVLGQGYYRESKWDKVLEMSAPAFRDYKEKGTKPRPSILFMYSEANFFKGDMEEAVKGYETLTELFPRFTVGKKAEKRLKEIKDKKE